MPAPTQQDPEVKTFSLGDFQLQSGETIPDAYIAYRTYGDKKNPCIVYPTWFSGTITAGNEWLISLPDHPRKSLDPSKYFIIVPALFGNGESTSPSNTSGDQGGIKLPKATFYDNVRAQNVLVTKHFGIEKIYAVIGWSMGAAQTFTWAAAYPEMVQLAIPFCGSARTSDHNIAFLEAVAGGITTDSEGWKQGHYKEQPLRGLKALARAYSGWGFSQSFYREKGFQKYFGLSSHEEIMTGFWEGYFCTKDANNLLYHVWTWRHGDIGSLPQYAGDSKRDVSKSAGGRFGARGNGEVLNQEDEKAFERALKGIKAKTLILPCKTDLYFPPEDSGIEHQIMGKETSQLKIIDSIWGHWAGGPGDSKVDAKWIDDQVQALFSENPPK